jgi:uncharacterized protein
MNFLPRWSRLFGACVLLLGLSIASAEETLPPPPANYFNDEVGLVSPAVAAQLNEELRNFDQKTSTQIVVFIAPTLATKSSLDDYAQRLYTAWHPGTKKESNGALLLIFPKEHQIRIQTGYGLEGALPDALCKRIIDDAMTPEFKKGDYNQGVIAGVTAMMKATAAEYQPSTLQKKKPTFSWMRLLFSPLGFFLLMIIGSSLLNWRNRGRGIGSTGPGWFIGGGGFGGGGDGGGFSGGGGDSGGGGASGGW